MLSSGAARPYVQVSGAVIGIVGEGHRGAANDGVMALEFRSVGRHASIFACRGHAGNDPQPCAPQKVDPALIARVRPALLHRSG